LLEVYAAAAAGQWCPDERANGLGHGGRAHLLRQPQERMSPDAEEDRVDNERIECEENKKEREIEEEELTEPGADYVCCQAEAIRQEEEGD